MKTVSSSIIQATFAHFCHIYALRCHLYHLDHLHGFLGHLHRRASIYQGHFFINRHVFVDCGKLFHDDILFLLSDFVIVAFPLFLRIKQTELILNRRHPFLAFHCKPPINRIHLVLVVDPRLVDILQALVQNRFKPLVLLLEYLHLDLGYLCE